MFFQLADRLRRRAWLSGLPAGEAHGKLGEDLAHRYLQRHGLTIVARNYRTRTGSGELDLVGWEGDTLVFVEVKTRIGDEVGEPASAVDHEKQARLLRAARDYVRRAGREESRVRFDIISVVLSDPPQLSHWRNVIQAERAL